VYPQIFTFKEGGKGNNVIQDFFHNLTRPCISFYRYKKPEPTNVPSFKASYAFVEGSVEEGEVEPETDPGILMAKIAWNWNIREKNHNTLLIFVTTNIYNTTTTQY
jgi:hypothetical protein